MTPERKSKLRVALISVLVVLVLAGTVLALRSMIPVDRAGTDTMSQNENQPVGNEQAVHSDRSETNAHPEDLPSDVPQPSHTRSETSSAKAAPMVIQPQSGRLAFEAQDKKLGEEAYQLERLPTGEYKLSSQGFFAFNVLASDVKFEYTQEIQLNQDLRPLAYSLEFHGPLGLGNRSTQIQIDGEKALISSGDQPREIPVPKGRFLLLGMFSSYVLATRMMTGSDPMHLTAFIAAGFEEPKDQPQDSSALTVPVEFVKLAAAKIRDKATGKEREVEQYRLRLGHDEHKDPESHGGLKLLASQGEFLGLIGVSQEASRGEFQVYRMDLFPHGFEILPAK